MNNIKHTNDDNNDKQYTYFEQIVSHKVHHYYLSRAITAPTEYTEMIHHIITSGPSDTIHIHLNTPGGRLDTGIQIINAMQASEAHIICSIEATAHSLGTIIFLAADEFIVHDNCIMMIHNYRGGMYGKGNEQIAELEATTKHFNALANHIYVPFLTKLELDKVLDGGDIWLQTEDIRERLINMVKIMERESAKKDNQLQGQTKKKAIPKKKRTTKKKS